jgi:molecular chaperone DnaK
VESKANAVKEALKGGDTARIRSAAGELEQAMQKVGQAVYQQPQGAAAPGSDGQRHEEPVQDSSTVEGEFREV